MGTGLPELTPEVYDHLHNLARRIHQERRGSDTVQPTVLLHEAWEKVSSSKQAFASRAHFMAVAAKAMRQILVDHARARNAQKRGGDAVRHTTLSGVGDDPASLIDVLALDDALSGLEALDADAAQVVVLRAFGGLTVGEVAEVLGRSVRGVERTWRFAVSYLADRLA